MLGECMLLHWLFKSERDPVGLRRTKDSERDGHPRLLASHA